ncbi:MAG: hypothetical protein K2P93_06120 [Alphaproteobacteria bacterium]|nr:hypothetical protein [Alphaproteobacteria bacterium]
MMKSISYLKLIFVSTGILFYSQWVEARKIEYDIPCEEQTFSDSSFNRSSVHVSQYTPEDSKNNNSHSILFLHGGPGISNEGQFDLFISEFTNQGFSVYVPEIIGSSYYDTSGMDANEYRKNYFKDIQATLDNIKENSSGDIYAISHSIGCHQLFHFVSGPGNKVFKKISAIAGPWDVGANRLYVLGKHWRNGYENIQENIRGSCLRSFVGSYAKLEEGQKPMTTSYNPVVTRELNHRFSILYNIDQLPKTLPIQLLHAKDDKLVDFSLSLAMYSALANSGYKVYGYFMPKGDHGFIKNPTQLNDPDLTSEERISAAKSILHFFEQEEIRENSIYFNNNPIQDIQDVPSDWNSITEHEEFLRSNQNI